MGRQSYGPMNIPRPNPQDCERDVIPHCDYVSLPGERNFEMGLGFSDQLTLK